MDRTSLLSVGGLGFALQGQVPVKVQELYLPFIDPGAAPDVVVTLRLRDTTLPETGGDLSCIYETGGVWSLHCGGDGYVLHVPSSGAVAATQFKALISKDLKEVDLYVSRESLTGSVDGRPALLLEAMMYPLAELLLIWILARQGGLLVHAAGVADGVRGYLFAGNSGHGKTTMARLWAGDSTILNDDRIVVIPCEGGFWMYGTPWHGDYQQVSPGAFPVSKIFFLSQSASNHSHFRPIPRAATLLLTRCFLPIWDRQAMATLLASCEAVASAVPCYELGFRPEPGIVDYIKGLA